MNRNRTLLTILAVTAALALAACGSDSAPKSGAPASAGADGSWQATLQQARGQTVRWWMYGGDDKINAYVDDDVAAALAKFGVTLKRVLAINGAPAQHTTATSPTVAAAKPVLLPLRARVS